MTTVPTPSVSFAPFALPALADGSPSPLPRPSPAPSLPPHAPPANDASVPARSDDSPYGRLVSHPRVRAYLFARLRPIRIPQPDKEDLVYSVLAVLWQRRTDRRPARTLPRMIGLARTILKGKLVDYCRHQDCLDEHIVDAPTAHQEDGASRNGPGDQPNYVDELRPPRAVTPHHALEAKQKMLYVNEIAPRIGLTDDDIEVMYAMTYDHEETTWAELAAERGVRTEALKKRIHRLWERIDTGWKKRLAVKVTPKLLLTLMLLLMLLFYVLAAIGPARNPPPPPAPLPEPTVNAPAPVAPTATTPATALPWPSDDGRIGPKAPH